MTRLPIPVIEPGSPARFPPPEHAMVEPNGLLAIGGDLAPERLLAAYAQGIFPWFSAGEAILWWSPDPRCVLRTNAIHVGRSLRRQLRQSDWTLTADQAFREVIESCARPRPQQPGTWIVPEMIDAYCALHDFGHAHSVEVWDGSTLIGGIYGVAVGRLFCGESMFSNASGGSKVALLALADALATWNVPLLDAQIPNPHLASLGAIELPRRVFLHQVVDLAASMPNADAWHDLPITHARQLCAAQDTAGPGCRPLL